VRTLLVVLGFALAGTGALDRGTVTIAAREGPVTVKVEIADSVSERRRGLMGRRTLAPRAGMLFVHAEDVGGGYWMKGTLIPLDIAFLSARGRILRTFAMTPCRRDPCRVYDPGVRYRSALEVNAGSFRRWGVRVGDRVSRAG
jgi:uncharacterized membrane protein (UPF0127 family)